MKLDLYVSFKDDKVAVFCPGEDRYDVFEKTSYLHLDLSSYNVFYISNSYSKELSINNTWLDLIQILVFLFPTESFSPLPKDIKDFLLNKLNQNNSTQENSVQGVKLEEGVSTDGFYQDSLIVSEIHNYLNTFLFNLPSQEKVNIVSLLEESRKESPWFAYIYNLYTTNLDGFPTKVKFPNLTQIFEDRGQVDELFSNNDINQITEAETLQTLENLTASFNSSRADQKHYAKEVSNMFNVNNEEKINIVFAEAETGVGKTLGYLSSIVNFLHRNPKEKVVISTYTKNLQRQIYQEVNSHINKYKFIKPVSIKGVNNYVCLLNYENVLSNPFLYKNSRFFMSVITRWLLLSEDQDLRSGDINPIISDMFQESDLNNLANSREECTYNSCPHFKKCFVFKAYDKLKESNLVVSNHSLTFSSNRIKSNYIVYDEAHYVNQVADVMFSSEIGIIQLAGIRRWLLGSSNRASALKPVNGLKQRIDNIINSSATEQDTEEKSASEKEIDESIYEVLEQLLEAANALPLYNPGINNIKGNSPSGEFESFLYEVYSYCMRSTEDTNQEYNIEVLSEAEDKILNTASNLKEVVLQILDLSYGFTSSLQEKLVVSQNEVVQKSLNELQATFEKYVKDTFEVYLELINELEYKSKDFIYRFVVEKSRGNIFDIKYIRNHLDPSIPFASQVLENLKGATFTSATLSTYKNDIEKAKEEMYQEFGINFISNKDLYHCSLGSPFNYEKQGLIITLNNSRNMKDSEVANVVKNLCLASNGGVLSLFTAISRVNSVYPKVKYGLQDTHMNIYSQYIDGSRSLNIVDKFKNDENSCLIATNLMVDGVDIPGNSLRMVLFDKVPWPNKSDNLVKIRTNHFGKSYTQKIIKKRLRQAFGRLIRKETDQGIFVMLSNGVPSYVYDIFPKEINIEKNETLENAVYKIKNFFG